MREKVALNEAGAKLWGLVVRGGSRKRGVARQAQQCGFPRVGLDGREQGGAGCRRTEHLAHRGQESLARGVSQPAIVADAYAPIPFRARTRPISGIGAVNAGRKVSLASVTK